jgi:hypothetical protein
MSINEKNKKWFIVITAVIVCFAFSPPQAGGGTGWMEEQKFLALDGSASDWFGYSVSTSGDYAIVGAYLDDVNGADSGSAYIFKWDETGWVQQAKLTASDGNTNDLFGLSVSISGDYAIVGAYGDDSYKGSAYIFKQAGTSWSQQQKLTASDGIANDLFGWSASISGDYAIVGAYQDDVNGTDSGSAYIFKRDETSWSQQAKLTASDGTGYESFGYSVSISGDLAIVGANVDDDNGSNSGSAYIFRRDVASWSQQQKLTASDACSSDWFGYSVSTSGDYAIVGAEGNDDKGSNSGSAYIFRWDGTNWVQQQKFLASDGAASDYFGRSVSISGDLAIVGADGNDVKGSNSGSAYIFKRGGTSWVQQQKLTASDGAADDRFGISVSISGDYAIVGAYLDDVNGADSGSAYAFKFCPRADLDDDCKVDFADFAIFADWWLYGTD